MFLFILAGIAFWFCIGIYIYLTWNYGYWKKRHVEGPEPKLLYGTFPKTLTSKCNFVDELTEIYKKYKGKYKFVGTFMTRIPQLFILDPQLANEVLVSKFKCFHDNLSSKWTSEKVETLRPCSPFVASGSTWKERRSEIIPGLTMRAFYPAVKAVCKKLTKSIRRKIRDGEGRSVDAKQISYQFTAEMVSDFIWGIEANAFESTKSPVLTMREEMIAQSFRCVKFFYLAGIFPLMRKFHFVRFFSEKVEAFFIQLLKDAMKLESSDSKDDGRFISHLKQKTHLSIGQLAGHTTTVVIDGFETAGSTIAHCLLMLARNMDAQKRLRQEINENLEADGFLSFETLNNLSYLDQCIYETLRIFPPLPFATKICTESVQLENSNGASVTLSPGDIVNISIYSFQRDAEYFPNPEEFKPERFDEDNGGIKMYREIGVLLPFGVGPRMCLGQKFGLFETKAAIVEIVKNFEITLSSRTRLDNKCSANGFLLSLDGGIYLQFSNI